jgi:thermitase
VAVVPVVAAAWAFGAPGAVAADFPHESLALGHPALHSEAAASGGIVDSRVPPVARAVADELLVTLRSSTRAGVLRRIRARPGISIVGSLPHLPVIAVRVQGVARGQSLRWLQSLAGVVSVQPDTIESPVSADCPLAVDCSIPNDPGFSYQWYLYNAPGVRQPPGGGTPIDGADVDAPGAWSRTRGDQGVRIAILDTGIDAGHPDLAGKVVAAANFTASNTVQDLSGHGTHVAGVAAASFDNALGIAGVAPLAQLMDVKVLAVDESGRTGGDCADVADGVVWAIDHGADVLNLSLGSAGPCLALQTAVAYASSHGALVVAAAGNEGSTSRFYPAAFPDVLSVAATTNRDQLAGFSNRGANWVDVAAPGEGIVSTLPTYDNGTGAINYGYLSGTSMAAPVVSGIAALIFPLTRTATAGPGVEARILATAQQITGTGVDFRYGRVDACRAVTGSAQLCGTPIAPAPSPTPPAPAPPQTAQPAPIPSTTGKRNAAPGTYTARLVRAAGRLRLVVGDGGDALIRIQGTVQLGCRKRRTLSGRFAALSTTIYGQIRVGGKFRIRTRRVAGSLRRTRLEVAGAFNATRGLAGGTVRLRGQAGSAGACDSRAIRWSAARLT